MKATKKNIKAVVKQYIETQNLTEFCKSMKAMGLVKRDDIRSLLKDTISHRMYMKYFFGLIPLCEDGWRETHGNACLNRDLDGKVEKNRRYDILENWNLLKTMQRNKASGNYKKILFVGNKHIYWCSPDYGHRDYNKSIWRENTEENRRKAEVINAYLTND